MREAFLVLVLDISASPPAVLGASIFSEDQPTLGMNRRCFTIHSDLAPTYGEAYVSVRDAIASHPFFAWVRPIFQERDGSNPFAANAPTRDAGGE